MDRIVNPDRPLKLAERIIPTLTAKKDQKLRNHLVELVANLRAADAPMYEAICGCEAGRITDAEYYALYEKLITAYDALADIVEYMPLPA